MNPVLKGLYMIGYVVYWTFYILLALIIFIVIGLPYVFLTLPYTLFYFSSNWPMRRRHDPPVEAYLHCFEQLHPDLMAYVIAANGGPDSENAPMPTTINEERTPFSHTASLSARLGDVGWKRRLLWTFLRDNVEQPGLPTPEERAAFAKSMKVMNSHNILNPQWGSRSLLDYFRRKSRDEEKGKLAEHEAETVIEARYAHLGRPVERLRHGSTRISPQRLPAHEPAWRGSKKDSDLEEGFDDCWQIADARDGYPWTDK
ncbi:hypothetical protein OQA88_2451 [Cercophora sp. LCS_1]